MKKNIRRYRFKLAEGPDICNSGRYLYCVGDDYPSGSRYLAAYDLCAI